MAKKLTLTPVDPDYPPKELALLRASLLPLAPHTFTHTSTLKREEE